MVDKNAIKLYGVFNNIKKNIIVYNRHWVWKSFTEDEDWAQDHLLVASQVLNQLSYLGLTCLSNL